MTGANELHHVHGLKSLTPSAETLTDLAAQTSCGLAAL